MLPFLAAAAAAEKVRPLDKLQNVSGQFWIKVIVGACIFAGIIFLFKKAMGMNKIILTIIIAVVFGVFGVSWVYNRNEPAFMTPIIAPIADSGFFPTKGAYDNKQAQDITMPGASKPGPAKTPTQPAKK
jgi:ABC-type uncharacterized transport system permease subunit